MKTVVFRADGAKKIGMGHLNRCYLIAKYLNYYCNIYSILVTKSDSASRLFLSKKNKVFETIYIENGCTPKDEVELFSNLKKNRGVSLILMDLLEIEAKTGNEYLKNLKKINTPVCVISDDSNYHEFIADLVINGNPNQTSGKYLKASGKYLIGPKYFIMDTEYSCLLDAPRIEGRIIVSLGVSDHNDILFSILNSLVNISSIQEIIIISSKSTGYADKLLSFSDKYPKNKIKIYFDVESLSSYWSSCSLAITAGGNTLFERIASSIPGATICQLARQVEIADAFEKYGVNVNLGYGPNLDHDKLDAMIREFIGNKKEHCKQMKLSRQVVSGNGIKYCIKEILKLLN